MLLFCLVALFIENVRCKCFSISVTREEKADSMVALCCPDKTTFTYEKGVTGVSDGIVWPCMKEAFTENGELATGQSTSSMLVMLSIFTVATACIALSTLALYYILKVVPAEREAAQAYVGRRLPILPRAELEVDESSTFTNYPVPIPAPRTSTPYFLHARQITYQEYSSVTSDDGLYERVNVEVHEQSHEQSPGTTFQSANVVDGINQRNRSVTE